MHSTKKVQDLCKYWNAKNITDYGDQRVNFKTINVADIKRSVNVKDHCIKKGFQTQDKLIDAWVLWLIGYRPDHMKGYMFSANEIQQIRDGIIRMAKECS